MPCAPLLSPPSPAALLSWPLPVCSCRFRFALALTRALPLPPLATPLVAPLSPRPALPASSMLSSMPPLPSLSVPPLPSRYASSPCGSPPPPRSRKASRSRSTGWSARTTHVWGALNEPAAGAQCSARTARAYNAASRTVCRRCSHSARLLRSSIVALTLRSIARSHAAKGLTTRGGEAVTLLQCSVASTRRCSRTMRCHARVCASRRGRSS